MESAWSNGKPAYRCRHGHTSAARPDPARPRNAYVREEIVLAQLPALSGLLTRVQPADSGRSARSSRGTDVRTAITDVAGIIGYLREHGSSLSGTRPQLPCARAPLKPLPRTQVNPQGFLGGPDRIKKGSTNTRKGRRSFRRRAKPAPWWPPQPARKEDGMGFYCVAAHRPDSRSARRRIRSKSVAEGITLPEL
jgi:hypothetical protein